MSELAEPALLNKNNEFYPALLLLNRNWPRNVPQSRTGCMKTEGARNQQSGRASSSGPRFPVENTRTCNAHDLERDGRIPGGITILNLNVAAHEKWVNSAERKCRIEGYPIVMGCERQRISSDLVADIKALRGQIRAEAIFDQLRGCDRRGIQCCDNVATNFHHDPTPSLFSFGSP